MEKHNKIKLPKICGTWFLAFLKTLLYTNKIRILSFIQRKHILFIKGSFLKIWNNIVQPFSFKNELCSDFQIKICEI